MYNIMSCQGFSAEVMGGCSIAWFGAGALFFMVAITRKWIGEEMGIDFNFWAGIAGCYIAYIILISFFGSTMWAMGGGAIGMILGGFGVGAVTGGSEGEDY